MQLLSSLHSFHDLGKGCRIGDGHVSENLAVQLDARLGKLVNELAVADAEFTDSGIETSDPQRAEVTLLVAAVSVGILTGVGYVLRRSREGTLVLARGILTLLMQRQADA